MTAWVISGILGFLAGGGLIWFCKDPVTRWYKGAENFVGDLEDQVRALRQRLK
jgi:hypothetical protein